MVPWDSDHLAVALEYWHPRQKSTPRAYFEKTILTDYKNELLLSLCKLLADHSYWNIENRGILDTKQLMEYPIQDLQDLGNWSLGNIKVILIGLFEAQSCLKNAMYGGEAAIIKQTNQELTRLANLAQADKASRLEIKLHKATLKGINKKRNTRYMERICQLDMIYFGGIKFFIAMYNQKNR